MSKVAVAACAGLLLIVLQHPSAIAADVFEVIAACERTTGCDFSVADNGDVSGCVVKENAGPGSCFWCNGSTGECISVRQLPGGKHLPQAGDVLRMFESADPYKAPASTLNVWPPSDGVNPIR